MLLGRGAAAEPSGLRERWPVALKLKGRPQAGRALRAEHLHEDPAGEGEGEEKVLLWRCVTVCS